jgi:tRNA threonylcarbamoyl adenosine modification protein (Sua5/YciO/YrdC/YwlC family)
VKLITREELQSDEKLIEMLKKSVFVYPTDTIYGIGCDAMSNNAVKRVREIKGREMKPFSVIAPDKGWIFENCIVSEKAKEWIDKLPGAYTFIFKLKNRGAVAENVSLGETIGIRIPKHWISEVVSKLGVPIVTTSANLTGKPFMTSLDDLDESIKEKVDFIIYEDGKKGTPSSVIDLTGNETKVLR